MVNQLETREETAEASNVLLSGLRRVLMAGVGAVALTQEPIEQFAGKLVERNRLGIRQGMAVSCSVTYLTGVRRYCRTAANGLRRRLTGASRVYWRV